MLPWIYAFASGYALISFIFFKFPHLLHKPKKQSFKAVHISHRGGAAECYENTMTAFRKAISLGTDMIELDCHLTRDGHVVVSHDNDLSRITGHNLLISDLNYSELPELLENLEVQFKPGTIYSDETSDRKMPLLEDVFAEFPHVAINIDIKINNDLLIEKVSDLVVKYKREHMTVWGNKDQEIVNKCYRFNPNIKTIFSLRQVFFLILAYYFGLLPFLPLREEFYEVPMPSLIRAFFETGPNASRFKLFLVDFFDKLTMRPSLFNHLKKRGIQTYLWVLNTEAEYERAIHVIGADGIMTDYPTNLRTYLLQNHPSWRPLEIKK